MPKIARILPIAILVIVALFLLHSADAQRYGARDNRNKHNNQAGDFDYYALVMSWSPTHCATPQGRRDRTQCNRRDGRRYAFVLHGLWPQYERGYPSNCRTRQRPFVPSRTIDGMLDIMPGKGLIIHEYRKHGTCSGMTPDDYFALSRRLFKTIEIPASFVRPDKPQMINPNGLVSQFVAVNPEIKHDMIAVTCRGSGNRLREIRICFSKDGKPRSCGHNENQRKLCSAPRMFVPPVRATASSSRPKKPMQRKTYPESPLPMPRG